MPPGHRLIVPVQLLHEIERRADRRHGQLRGLVKIGRRPRARGQAPPDFASTWAGTPLCKATLTPIPSIGQHCVGQAALLGSQKQLAQPPV